MRRFRSYFLLILPAFLCGCGRTAAPDVPGGEPLRNPNAFLSILHEGGYCEGRVLDEDFVFEGCVTTTDSSGNFFRTFVIQDVTGAVEIYAGFGPLHDVYFPGRRVVVYAEGLSVVRTDGIIRLGTHINPYSSYRVEPFGTRVIMDKYVYPDTVCAEIIPCTARIEDLKTTDCGKLVKIDGLTQDEQEAGFTWAYEGDDISLPETGVRRFSDGAGNRIAVVTSGYADFAGEVVPAGKISLSGILVYGGFGDSGEECFGIKLRSIDDVAY